MKNNKNIIALTFLVIFTIFFYYYNKQTSIDSDYYELNGTTYLKKNDYFSSYSIYQKINQEYRVILSDVESLAIKKDSVFIKYRNDNIIKNALIIQNGIKPILENNKNNEIELFSNLEFSKPWHIVEQKTLSTNSKLIPQLLLILIIISGLYLFMNVFKIKQIKKSL